MGRVLKMHAAQSASHRREGSAVLNETRLQAMGGEFPLAECAGEKTTVIACGFQLHKPSILQSRFTKKHGNSSGFGLYNVLTLLQTL
jgi:hypothetical protein